MKLFHIILSLNFRHFTEEKIGKSTIENFYYGRGDPKFSTVVSIMRWVESKEISDSLDNNLNNNPE